MSALQQSPSAGGYSVSDLSPAFPRVENPSVIVVMGCTGSGRTTFINTATGSKEPVGHGLKATTTTIRTVESFHPRDKTPVVFVDTPGWDSENGNDGDILENIAKWIMSEGSRMKLIGILYLHPISDIRMVRTSARSLRLLRELCGDGALNKVIFLTTMWTEVSASRGARRETELREKYWAPMIKLGSRVARFNDTMGSAWQAIDPLFVTGERMKLEISNQLDSMVTLSQTGAGVVLEEEKKEITRDERTASPRTLELLRFLPRRREPKVSRVES